MTFILPRALCCPLHLIRYINIELLLFDDDIELYLKTHAIYDALKIDPETDLVSFYLRYQFVCVEHTYSYVDLSSLALHQPICSQCVDRRRICR